MRKVKGEHWKVDERTIRIQIKTDEEQCKLEEALPGWQCVSYGYVPKTSEDIYVFEREFDSDKEWMSFKNSDKITNLIEMREV
jgi:hypothetical protein